MNQNDILINVQVNGINQVNALSNAMRVVNARMAGTITAAHNLDAGARALSNALGRTNSGLQDHAKTLSQVIANQSALSNELRRSRADHQALSRSFALNTQEGRKSIRAMREYSESLKSIKARALVSDLRSVAIEMRRLGKDAQFTGRSMIIGITTPILAFAQTGLNSFLAMDKEMVRLNKLIDDMAKSYENAYIKMGIAVEDFNKVTEEEKARAAEMVNEYQLREAQIIEISRKFGVAKELVAGIAGDFAELGLASNDSTIALTKLVTEAEKLGSLDIGPSKDLILAMYSQSVTMIQENALARGKLIKAIDAEAEAVKVARSQLYLFNAVENSTALSLADLAQSFPEVAAATTQFGISMTEAAAFLAPMKAAGFEIGASSNSIKVSLQRLNDPTVKATERMIALSEATGYDFQDAASIGMTAIDALAGGYEVLVRQTNLGKEGVQELFNTLFESRQGPRMQVLIENLALFNREMNQMGTTASNMVVMANKMNQGNLPLIRSFSDLGAIARISAADLYDTVSYLDETGKRAEFRVTADAKASAMQIRETIGEYIEENRKNGIDVINQINSQAGRALMVQFAGPGIAASRAKLELDTALDSIKVTIDILKNDFKIMASEVIKGLTPILEFAGKIVGKLTDSFQKMNPTAKTLLLGLLALLASLGPLVFAFGQARLAVSTLMLAFLKFVPGLKNLTYESLAASPALLRLANPVQVVNGAVETSANRFAILTARLASMPGPIGKIGEALGRMTGSLKSVSTASGEVVANVNAIKKSSEIRKLLTGRSATDLRQGAVYQSAVSVKKPKFTPLPKIADPMAEYLKTQGGQNVIDFRTEQRTARQSLIASGVNKASAYRKVRQAAIDEYIDEVLQGTVYERDKLSGLIKNVTTGKKASAKVIKDTIDTATSMFDYMEKEADLLDRKIKAHEAAIIKRTKIAASNKVKRKAYINRRRKARADQFRETIAITKAGVPLSEFDRVISNERIAQRLPPIGNIAVDEQKKLARRISVGRQKGVEYTTGAARYRGRELSYGRESMILRGGIEEKLVKAYLPFQKIGDPIGGGIKKIAEPVFGGIKFLAEKTFEGIKLLGIGVFKASKFVGGKAAEGAKFIGNKFTDFYNSVSPKISSGLNKVGNAVTSSFNKFHNILYTKFTEPLIRNLKLLPAIIVNRMTDVSLAISNSYTSITNAVASRFNTFQDFLFRNITSPTISFFKKLPSKIKSTLVAISSEISDPKFMRGLFLGMAGAYDVGLQKLKAGMINSINRITGPVKLAMTRFKNTINDPVSIRGAFLAMAGAYDIGFQKLKTVIPNSIQKTKNAMILASDKIRELLFYTSGNKDVDSWMPKQSLFSRMRNSFVEGFGFVRNGIGNALDEIYIQAAAFPTRLKNGISKSTSVIKNVATSIGKAPIGLVQNVALKFRYPKLNNIQKNIYNALNPPSIKNIFKTLSKKVSMDADRLFIDMITPRGAFREPRTAKEFITQTFKSMSSSTVSGARFVRRNITNSFVNIRNTLLSASVTVAESLGSISATMSSGFSAMAASARNGIRRVNVAIMSGTIATQNALAAYAAQFLNFSKLQLTGGFTNLLRALNPIGGKIGGKFKNIGNSIRNGLTNIKNIDVKSAFKNLDQKLSTSKFVKQTFSKDDAGNLLPDAIPQGKQAASLPRRMISSARVKAYSLTGIPKMKNAVEGYKTARLDYMTSPGKTPNAFMGQMKGIGGFLKGIKMATMGIKLLRVALLGLGVGAVLIAIAAAVALVFRFIKKGGSTVEKVKENFVSAWKKIKEAIDAVIKPIRDAIYTLAELGGGGGGGNMFLTISEKIKEIAAAISNFVIKYIAPIIRFVMEQVVDVIIGVVRIVKGIIKIFQGDWKEGLKLILKGLVGIARGIINIIFGVVKAWIKIWQFLVGILISLTTSIASGIVQLIGGAIQAVFNWLADISSEIPVLGRLFGGVSDVVGSITDTLSGIVEGAGDIGKNIVDAVANTANSGVEGLRDLVMSGIEALIGEQEKLKDSTGKDLFPDDARKEGEDWGEEFVDGAGEGLSGLGDAVKGALADLGQKFVDLVLGHVNDSMKKAVEEMTKALEMQRDAALAVFDSQLEALEQLEKAEESLTKEMEYQAERRKMIAERALQAQNYQRNRALAIYEGRIDDARVLSLEEQKNVLDFQDSLAKLDEGRRRDLASENLDAIRDSINKAKDEAGKFFDDQIQKFAEAAAEITRFGPLTVGEYRDQINELNRVATELSGENTTTFSGMLENMVNTIQDVIPNRGVPVFRTEMGKLVGVAIEKYGFLPNEVSYMTVQMLLRAGGILATDTTLQGHFGDIITRMQEQADGGFNLIAVQTFTPAMQDLARIVRDNNPMTIFARAVRLANREILYDMQKLLTGVASKVKWLLPYLDKRLVTMAALDALAQNQGGGGDYTDPTLLEGSNAARAIKLYSQYGGPIPKYINGGKIRSFAVGGMNTNFVVPGYTSTPVPAILHGGEYVINSKAVSNIGVAALEALNHMKFATPRASTSYQAQGGTMSGTSTYNIYVDTFIGEDEWFNQMTKKYNMNVLPRNQKSAGLEGRTLTSYSGLARGG